ncbi:hypothetical protein QO200_12550 [Flavobacterium sp. Arc3]|uniref:hypothetical protein n=1 Tax=Flavobacterium sp. Arc3 TaxID=3046686 RepID=UPI00352DBD2B
MNNKTKFAILPIIICTVTTTLAFGLLYITLNSSKAGILIPLLLLIFVIYFFLNEFRTKAHKIEIQNEKIIVKKYFGLGKKKFFKLKDLEGFNVLIQPSKSGCYEYIFILNEGKRIASISEFYHRNYITMKSAIEKKIKYLGQTEYKFKNEYKEMFK